MPTGSHTSAPRPALAGGGRSLPPALAVRVALIIAVGAILLTAVTLVARPDDRIGAPWAGVSGGYATLLGILFWGSLTLVASGVSAELPEGTRLVWLLAPMVSTMSLGGPLVAAWVAALATTEPRELRGGVPWYGVCQRRPKPEQIAPLETCTPLSVPWRPTAPPRACPAGGSSRP